MTGATITGATAELELLLRATLLIGAAWAAAATLRIAGASAAARHIVWLFGIAALLALPLLWWLAPALPILLPEAAALPPLTAAAPPAPDLARAAAPASPEFWSTVLLIAYALGAAMLLLRFAGVHYRLSRLWRDAEPAQDPAWRHLMSNLSREMRLARRVELRIARGPAMPMTWGTLAPKLLLPAEAEAWPFEQRRLVLLHELAHVARRDSLSRSAASLACALYWFHPGAWFAARQLRMEQEHAADDRVLTAGAPARSYALSLLHLATRIEGSRSEHAAAMAGTCQLERRLVAITTPARRDRPGLVFLFASALAAAFVTLVAAAGVPVRPLAALPDPLRAEPSPLAAFPAESVVPTPAEIRTEAEAQGPTRAGEGGPVDAGTRLQPMEVDPPMPQPSGRPAEAAAPQADPPAPSLTIDVRVDRVERAAPADPRRSAAYGPQLPQRVGEGPDSDARIPWAAREDDRSNSANAGDPGTAPAQSRARRAASWVRPVVSLLIDQVRP